LMEKLAASLEVEVPEALVEAETASILQEMLGTIRATGGRVEGLPESAEALTARAQEIARRRVKESLLLEAVARQEGLAVEEAELNREIETMAAAFPAERGASVRQAMEDSERRAALTARLLERKALDFLMQHAQITDAYNLITPG
jgi:trigger factor